MKPTPIRIATRKILHSLLLLIVGTCGAWAQAPAAPAPAASAPGASQGGMPADMAAAEQMPDGPDQKKALAAAASAWAKSDPIAFYTWIFTLDPKHFGGVASSTSAASGSADPKAAGDFLAQHVPADKMILVHGFTLVWARDNAAAAEAWATGPGLPRDVQYLAIFSVADALCRKNAQTAVAWVATVTPPEQHEAAIDGLMCIWTRGDVVAATNWLKQQPPADMKWGAMILADNFRLSKEKTTPLETWIAQLPLSDADKQQVLKGPHPDSSHISKFQPAPDAAPAKP